MSVLVDGTRAQVLGRLIYRYFVIRVIDFHIKHLTCCIFMWVMFILRHTYYMHVFALDIFVFISTEEINLIQCHAKYCKSSTCHFMCNFTLASCSYVCQRQTKRKELNSTEPFNNHSLTVNFETFRLIKYEKSHFLKPLFANTGKRIKKFWMSFPRHRIQ